MILPLYYYGFHLTFVLNFDSSCRSYRSDLIFFFPCLYSETGVQLRVRAAFRMDPWRGMLGKWLQGLFTIKPSVILEVLKVWSDTLAPLQIFGCMQSCSFGGNVSCMLGKPSVLKSCNACLKYCNALVLLTFKLLFTFDADQSLSELLSHLDKIHW